MDTVEVYCPINTNWLIGGKTFILGKNAQVTGRYQEYLDNDIIRAVPVMVGDLVIEFELTVYKIFKVKVWIPECYITIKVEPKIYDCRRR
jgi:hypothetical protein